jgi:hypothetical protein
MKNDKFLIAILAGIVVLVAAAIIIVLARANAEEYTADDTPTGVVHNYFLAIQRKEYEKAYGYLSDELKSKPDLDDFIITVDNRGNYPETALKIGEATTSDTRAQVRVSLTTFNDSGLFDSRSYTNQDTVHLRADANGRWKIIQYVYPYWGYNWNEDSK